jgi:hypothetical protein
MIRVLNTRRDNVYVQYEANHSPPSGADVNNVWSQYLLFLNILVVWTGTASPLWIVALK